MKPSLVLLLTALINLQNSEAKSKSVTVELDAKWHHTPILLEVSEYVAKESNTHFWRFVDDLHEMGKSATNLINDEESYNVAMKLASHLLSPVQCKLLKLALSIRAHSPTIEMHHQVAMEKNPPAGCEAFVEVNNLITCEEGAFRAYLNMAENQTKPTLVTNDHIYPSPSDQQVIVILYGQMATPHFIHWHSLLRGLAKEGNITYVLRHFVQNRRADKVRLSGYGVELAIKNQEYKAKDDTKVQGEEGDKPGEDSEEVHGFVFSTLKKLYPELTDNLNEFKQYLIDSNKVLAPLKVWQLQDLSFQAVQRILSVPPEDQLQTLRDLSQNFPIMARSLVKTSVNKELRNEIQRNQKIFMSTLGLEPGESALFINGLQAHLGVYDVFSLLETMRNEAKLMEGLYNLGAQYDISGKKMMDLLKLDLHDVDSNYAIDIRHKSIVYINDLEKDRRYAGWQSSVQDILRPTFPGMLRHIRKNFFHVVFIVNPADKQYKDLLKMAEAFFVHNAPIRIGLLFVVPSDEGSLREAGLAMIRAFHFISEQESPAKGLAFITDILDLDGVHVQKEDVISEFSEKPYKSSDVKAVFESNKYDVKINQSLEYFKHTGLGDVPQVLVNGVPMKKHELDPDEFEESVVSAILRQTPTLQTAVYNNWLTDNKDILDYVMTQSNVMPRLNSRILSGDDHQIDFTADMPSSLYKNKEGFMSLMPEQMAAVLLANMKYLTKKDDTSVIHSVTNWIIGDLNTSQGRSLLYAGIKHLRHSTESRIGVVHNPTNLPRDDNRDDFFIPDAIQAALETLDVSTAKSFITKLVKEENVEALKKGEKTLEDLAVHGMDFQAYDKARQTLSDTYQFIHRAFVERVLKFKPGQRGVICNDKVLGPLKSNEDFLQEDFDLLDKYSQRVSAGKVTEKIQMFGLRGPRASDLIMRSLSLLMSVSQHEGRKEVPFWKDKDSVIKVSPSDNTQPAYQIVAIIDPLTRAAQKYTPILMVLQEVINVDIKVFFNCKEKLSEMPLKSFYRFVLEAELSFTVGSDLASGPVAFFQNMPEAPLLTLGMDPPESWLVEAVKTPYDLDNIYLEEVESGVHAIFELEYLLLEGHCFDSVSGQPPRGLQFILGTNRTQDMVDTIVMANLGYFQLKATPGVWNLRLRLGRSRDIYEITSHELTDSPSNSPNVIVVMDSFKTKIIKIRVGKKPGMEHIDLLEEEEQQKGLWDSISSKFTGASSVDTGPGDDVINIFSVASGHLYERFLRIMMLSVMKHTKSKVKFWFLKNYLSPTFKDFIPHMAKEYNFEYELVQYKWPRWLHQQTEKQRIIWGYKILFLDVLFPLSVNKIIFVDADQIVRADLKELMEFDLEGAPYGYTPFCDSRKEMDGYRFWKSGYWASHLAGRKYHISALYVVDLKKFRKIAAGDRLRGQYQGLSQDPNSLSNLDQDLPNNMIHQVAIKSLPQEWLYCDTWCSSDELPKAKTIDLCNNPRTKEPKLEAAARIVPEWTDYDQEIKLLWDRVYGTNTASVSSKNESDKHEPDVNKDEL